MLLFSRLLSMRSLSVHGSCWLRGAGFPILTSSCGALTSEWWAAGSSELHSPSVVSVSLNLISSGSTLCLQGRDSSTINLGCFSSSSVRDGAFPALLQASLCFPGSQNLFSMATWPLYLHTAGTRVNARTAQPRMLCRAACSLLFSAQRGSCKVRGERLELLQPNNSKPTWQRGWFKVWGFLRPPVQ